MAIVNDWDSRDSYVIIIYCTFYKTKGTLFLRHYDANFSMNIEPIIVLELVFIHVVTHDIIIMMLWGESLGP